MNRSNILTKENIHIEYEKFSASISDIALSSDFTGPRLLHAVKRNPIGGNHPYSDVSFFEAANRIMTDLVIYKGVMWLLAESDLKVSGYQVEFGNENKRSHDILSTSSSVTTVAGEAFNVAPSFFRTKHSKMLSKLRDKSDASVKLIVVNSDAIPREFVPHLQDDERILLVDVFGNETRYM